MQFELFRNADDSLTVDADEWRQLARFPRYDVSTMGRFRRRSTMRIVTGTLAHNGYVHIGLIVDGKQRWALAHRLVAETFLEPPTEKQTDVNHRNKVRADNRLSNLEWVTRSQNMRHAVGKKK